MVSLKAVSKVEPDLWVYCDQLSAKSSPLLRDTGTTIAEVQD
jgi:hypothetical protein